MVKLGKNHTDWEELKKRTVIGLTEKLIIKGNEHSDNKELIARIDSGATKSSIDLTLASEMKLGPVVDSKVIKSAHGSKLRPVIEVEVIIHGKTIKARFTMADRARMRFPVLIGQNILNEGFIIDPQRSYIPKKEKEEVSDGKA